MSTFAAWLDIQRERIAHAIYPDAWVSGWTPRTVAQAISDDALRRKREALDARWATIDAQRAKTRVTCPPLNDGEKPDAVMVGTWASLSRIAEPRGGGAPRHE